MRIYTSRETRMKYAVQNAFGRDYIHQQLILVSRDANILEDELESAKIRIQELQRLVDSFQGGVTLGPGTYDIGPTGIREVKP